MPTTRPTTVAVATSAPSRGPAVQWSETQRGLTAGMSFIPFPVQLGTSTTYSVSLNDANGEPVSDATVELTVTGGMAGMEGEHDEDFPLKLANRGPGLYATEASPGSSDLVPTGISLRIQRGGQMWSFALPKDALSAR